MGISGLDTLLTGSTGNSLSGAGTAKSLQQSSQTGSIQADTADIDTYTASAGQLYPTLSNTTYSNLGVLNEPASSGTSRYVSATIGSFKIAENMQASQANRLFGSLDQYRAINTGDDEWSAAELSELKSRVESTQQGEKDKEITEDAAEEFKKDREAAEAQEAEAQAGQSAADASATAQAGSDEAAAEAGGEAEEASTAEPATEAGDTAGAAGDAAPEAAVVADQAGATTPGEAGDGNSDSQSPAASASLDVMV